jgi:hypothetical protein
MRHLLRLTMLALPAVSLAACGDFRPFGPRDRGAEAALARAAPDTPRPEARPGSGAVRPPPGARTAEAFDTTTEAERVAALAAAATPTRELGRTIASLGDPAEPGFWLLTPLVDNPRPGRVTHAPSGASVRLELRPSGGAPGSGSRLSLAAFRALGLPLTGLPELVVALE